MQFRLLVLLCGLVLCVRPVFAGDGLDVKDWLTRPGVKLLAVEFYASWCGPCKKAVPRWKKLHEQYRDQGLRLVVVSVQDPDGACVNPGWNPDDVICDSEGRLAEAMGVGDKLPAAFLWSWRGTLLVKKGHVDEVERAAEDELRRLPRITLDEDMEPAIRDLVRVEVGRTGKVDVVAGDEELEALARIRRRSHDLQYSARTSCRVGEQLAANSLLRAKRTATGGGERLFLQLFSAEKGCLTASAAVYWSERNPDVSMAEAVAELVNSLRGPVEMPGDAEASVSVREREFGERPDTWEPNVAVGIVVYFESDPPGALVMLDDKPVCQKTPCSKTVAPGSHKVDMHMERYVSQSERVKFDDSDQQVKLKLDPDFGWLTVRSTPPGMAVLLDGRNVGSTPLTEVAVDTGAHRIVASDPRYYDQGSDIVVERGEHEHLDFELPGREGAIQVTATDADGNDVEAETWVDERLVGRTPLVEKLLIGTHSVRVVWGGEAWERAVEVHEQETAELEASLEHRGRRGPTESGRRRDPGLPGMYHYGEGKPGKTSGAAGDGRKERVPARLALDLGIGLDYYMAHPDTNFGILLLLDAGVQLREMWQIGLFAHLGISYNSSAPTSDSSDSTVEGSVNYTGLYGLSARVWLPRAGKGAFMIGLYGGLGHVAGDQCIEWDGNECTQRKAWDSEGKPWGFGGGLMMAYSLPKAVGLYVGGRVGYLPVIGSNLGIQLGWAIF